MADPELRVAGALVVGDLHLGDRELGAQDGARAHGRSEVQPIGQRHQARQAVRRTTRMPLATSWTFSDDTALKRNANSTSPMRRTRPHWLPGLRRHPTTTSAPLATSPRGQGREGLRVARAIGVEERPEVGVRRRGPSGLDGGPVSAVLREHDDPDAAGYPRASSAVRSSPAVATLPVISTTVTGESRTMAPRAARHRSMIGAIEVSSLSAGIRLARSFMSPARPAARRGKNDGGEIAAIANPIGTPRSRGTRSVRRASRRPRGRPS